MVITLTENAVHELKTMTVEQNKYPRIDAVMVPGCGVTIKFEFVFDEPRRNDIEIHCKGIQIRIDHFTKYYLEEEVQVDYAKDEGFIVGENVASRVEVK